MRTKIDFSALGTLAKVLVILAFVGLGLFLSWLVLDEVFAVNKTRDQIADFFSWGDGYGS